MTTHRLLLPTLLAAGALLPVAQAKIGAFSDKQYLLDWSQFGMPASEPGRLFHDGLRSGLDLSGLFKDGTPTENDYRMVGDTVQKAGQVEATVRVFATHLREEVFAKRYQVQPRDARRLGAKVADEIVEALTGVPGIAGGQLVVRGDRSGHKELYLVRLDGSAPVQYTKDNSVAAEPKWGPQGRFVTYTSYHKRFPDAYRIDLQTGARVRISGESGLNAGAVLSPDGREVALILSMSGKPELYIKRMNASGAVGEPRRVTNTRPAAKSSPTWSPDGEQLAFVSDHEGSPQIYIVNRNGSGLRLVGEGRESVEPCWGRNNIIAYSQRTGNHYQLAIYDPQSNRHRVIALDGADWKEPSWAPNGRHLACTRTERYQSAVYVVDTVLRRKVRVAAGAGDWEAPSWSPK